MAGPQPGGSGGHAQGNKYPQYGVNQQFMTVTANNQAQKLRFMNQGYLEWFSSKSAAADFIKGQKGIGKGGIPNPVSWLADKAGGVAASALEAGLVSVMKDLWRVIGPWIELAGGVALFVIGFALFFKNQIMGAAGTIGSVAAAVVK